MVCEFKNEIYHYKFDIHQLIQIIRIPLNDPDNYELFYCGFNQIQQHKLLSSDVKTYLTRIVNIYSFW